MDYLPSINQKNMLVKRKSQCIQALKKIGPPTILAFLYFIFIISQFDTSLVLKDEILFLTTWLSAVIFLFGSVGIVTVLPELFIKNKIAKIESNMLDHDPEFSMTRCYWQ